jgi:hypothetical protein
MAVIIIRIIIIGSGEPVSTVAMVSRTDVPLAREPSSDRCPVAHVADYWTKLRAFVSPLPIWFCSVRNSTTKRTPYGVENITTSPSPCDSSTCTSTVAVPDTWSGEGLLSDGFHKKTITEILSKRVYRFPPHTLEINTYLRAWSWYVNRR